MKKDLFVFAGQSKMAGAAVLPPTEDITYARSLEYKHKPRRLGAPTGDFVSKAFPAGEFSYADIALAYRPDLVNEKGESALTDYDKNAYFAPGMCNLKSAPEKTVYPFPTFSESTAPAGPTLAPYLVSRWEQMGGNCAYAHIAKGGVPLRYYFTEEMAAAYAKRIAEHNRACGTNYAEQLPPYRHTPEAADYFFQKCRDFFADSEARFGEELSQNKCFFWLQGESDVNDSVEEHGIKLDILWNALKDAGFTHFFCIRVDYFGNENIYRVMQAQEQFVARHQDAYMLTRAASFIPHPEQKDDDWFVAPPTEEYQNCRESFLGYPNHHINEKGFSLIARRAAENLYRVLVKKEAPQLEKENLQLLIGE